jgi:hypothetical protein
MGLGQVGRKLSADFKSGKDKYERFFGVSDKQANESQDKVDAVSQERKNQTRGVLDGMKQDDVTYYNTAESAATKYKDASRSYGNAYLEKQGELAKQAESQAKDAQTTYSNDIAPNQKQLMERAMTNAGSAMSLEDAMNPNNKVASGVRDMYNKEGQTIRQQGLNDAGVLAALGAQATAGQMGGMPAFTGSNLAMMNAQNQRQSGEAFAAAQKRMMDMREQGLSKGLEQSNAMYDRGQVAQDRAAGRIGEYEGGMDRNIDRQRGFRDEQQNYAADRMGVQRGMAAEEFDIGQGLAGAQHGMRQDASNRELGFIGDDAADRTASIQNRAANVANNGAERRNQLLNMPANFFGGMMGAKMGGGGGGQVAGPSQSTYQGQNQGVAGGMYSGGSYGPPTYDQYEEGERQRYGRGR